MGGRRARSLDEIVGTGLGAQRATFTRAIGQESPDEIATSSAKLVANSEKVADILFYASKLVDFVQKAIKSSRDLNYEQREQLARRAWSRIQEGRRLTE